MLNKRRMGAIVTLIMLLAGSVAGFQTKGAGGRDLIKAGELNDWLNYLASDQLEGRNTFSEGLGLAAGYIAGQLKAWGVKPGGDEGKYYFQRVPHVSVKSTNRSSITIESNGQTRTFKEGEGVSFPPNVGVKRSFTADQIEFMGYGATLPGAPDDFAGKDVKGKVVVWLGTLGPAGIPPEARRLLFSRSRAALEERGAIAAIGPVIARGRRPGGGSAQPVQGQAQSANNQRRGDFDTPARLDREIKPSVQARDEFLEFLFAGQDVKYADLKQKADAREPLPKFALKNAKLTFNLDAEYQVVRTQFTRNVVGIIEGSDPKLKSTYVAFGAHYDHVGYADGPIVDQAGLPSQAPTADSSDGRGTFGGTQRQAGPRRDGAVGRVSSGAIDDIIWNGADDDGSGTVVLLALAKAFSQGLKPKRSILLVWHAGEEKGLLGSRHFADSPTVPLDSIVAQINMDMVGRNRNNDEKEANSIFVVGSDRISTELHNITIDANEALARPLTFDFAMNDPTDTEQIYYRSDHYSYAAKGIPIVFLFSGLHPDYHANTDSPEKINYEKMARVAQLAHEIGMRVGNATAPPVRDNRGPRIGKGRAGKLKG